MSKLDDTYAIVIASSSSTAYVYDEEELEEQVKFYKSKGWKVYVFKKDADKRWWNNA